MANEKQTAYTITEAMSILAITRTSVDRFIASGDLVLSHVAGDHRNGGAKLVTVASVEKLKRTRGKKQQQ